MSITKQHYVIISEEGNIIAILAVSAKERIPAALQPALEQYFDADVILPGIPDPDDNFNIVFEIKRSDEIDGLMPEEIRLVPAHLYIA